MCCVSSLCYVLCSLDFLVIILSLWLWFSVFLWQTECLHVKYASALLWGCTASVSHVLSQLSSSLHVVFGLLCQYVASALLHACLTRGNICAFWHHMGALICCNHRFKHKLTADITIISCPLCRNLVYFSEYLYHLATSKTSSNKIYQKCAVSLSLHQRVAAATVLFTYLSVARCDSPSITALSPSPCWPTSHPLPTLKH